MIPIWLHFSVLIFSILLYLWLLNIWNVFKVYEKFILILIMSYLSFRRKLMHNKEFKMTTSVNLGKFPWNFVQFEATWLHWGGLWHGQLFALYSDLSLGFAVGCPCLLFYFIYPFKCLYWVATVLGTVPLAEDKSTEQDRQDRVAWMELMFQI